jgi:hypothetical protein
MSLTDIEFLLGGVQQDARNIVYVYHSGRLLSEVKAKIKRQADLAGRMYMSSEPEDAVAAARGGSLFQGMRVCHWSRFPAPKSVLRRLRDAVLTGGDEQIVILVRRGEFSAEDIVALQDEGWLAFEEKPIGFEQLKQALRFFCETSDIVGAGNLYLNIAFERYFKTMIEEEGQQTVATFANEFDRVVLLHSDCYGAFRRESAVRARSKRIQLRQSFWGFIRARNQESLTSFVSNVSAIRERGVPDEELIDRLCRSLTEIVGSVRADELTYGERRSFAIFLVLFVTSFSKLKDAVRQNLDVNMESDGLLVVVDQIGRQLIRKSEPGVADPFVSSWSAREFQTERIGREKDASFRQLIEETISYIEIDGALLRLPWVLRFSQLIERLLDIASSDLATSMSPSIERKKGQTPLLGEILDQPVITRSLQNSLGKEQRGVPILLYGRDRIRRREIALAYARALLCEGRHETDLDACGLCESCRSFEARNSLGLVELEARMDTASNVRKTLEKLSYTSLTQYRVIIIESSGKSKESEDAFLEALEVGRESTTFILMVDRLELLAHATVSRCLPYRVKPLNEED